VPAGIETTAGGGTLTVNVFDASVEPVSGAVVHIYNKTTTTTVDTTRNTNVDGIATFAGAPAAANYEISVTKTGYSTDQTYSATTSNPTPITPHVAVIQSAVSTMNFQIDRLSDLLVRTVGPSTNGSFSDDFADMSKIATGTNNALVSGDIVLAGGAGAYVAMGTVFGTTTAPSAMTGWSTADWGATAPASTTLKVQLYSVSGTNTYTLIPDASLPGNSAGFTTGPINLSSVAPATYPALALGTTLTSSDVNITPALHDWRIDYVISEPSIGSIPFTLRSTKIIGSTPIYKYSQTHTTNGSGEIQLTGLEWDSYTLTLGTGAYDISNACPGLPYILNPGGSETLTLTLTSSVSHSFRVSVVDISGNPVIGADVQLTRSGVNQTKETSTCGQVFFNSGLSEATDYQVDVQKTGYTTQTVTGITVGDGTATLVVTLAHI
jgi:hypothetical protein